MHRMGQKPRNHIKFLFAPEANDSLNSGSSQLLESAGSHKWPRN